MKRYILIGILWFGFLTQLPAQHILSLTQADCRELALQCNEEVQKATNALQQAELTRRLPSVPICLNSTEWYRVPICFQTSK